MGSPPLIHRNDDQNARGSDIVKALGSSEDQPGPSSDSRYLPSKAPRELYECRVQGSARAEDRSPRDEKRHAFAPASASRPAAKSKKHQDQQPLLGNSHRFQDCRIQCAGKHRQHHSEDSSCHHASAFQQGGLVLRHCVSRHYAFRGVGRIDTHVVEGGKALREEARPTQAESGSSPRHPRCQWAVTS